MEYQEIKVWAEAAQADLVRDRRHFHQYPEVSTEEKETTEYIQRALEAMDIPYRLNGRGYGLVAELTGEAEGPCIAFRADIDALRVSELNEVSYRSQRDGVMHACGHDAHATVLLGLARVMSRERARIKGKLVFLFQPAEEIPPGGAHDLMEQGFCQGVDRIYGLHVRSSLPTGKIGYRVGPFMAATDEFSILIQGRGGHAAEAFEAIDPIVIAAQLVGALQTIVSRSVPACDDAVISVCNIHAGSSFNIIPDEALLRGTCRSFNKTVHDLLEKRIRDITTNLCAAYGAEAIITYRHGYPALVNNAEQNAFVRQAVEACGYETVELPPTMGGEDFAYYLEKIPGNFFNLGTLAPGQTEYVSHHNPCFDIDENALKIGLECFLAIYFKEIGALN